VIEYILFIYNLKALPPAPRPVFPRAMRVEDVPVPAGYVACAECGCVSSSGRPWFGHGSSGEICSKCSHSNPVFWLRNLTREKVKAQVLRLRSENARYYDREQLYYYFSAVNGANPLAGRKMVDEALAELDSPDVFLSY
jgi:hypothetical protein